MTRLPEKGLPAGEVEELARRVISVGGWWVLLGGGVMGVGGWWEVGFISLIHTKAR